MLNAEGPVQAVALGAMSPFSHRSRPHGPLSDLVIGEPSMLFRLHENFCFVLPFQSITPINSVPIYFMFVLIVQIPVIFALWCYMQFNLGRFADVGILPITYQSLQSFKTFCMSSELVLLLLSHEFLLTCKILLVILHACWVLEIYVHIQNFRSFYIILSLPGKLLINGSIIFFCIISAHWSFSGRLFTYWTCFGAATVDSLLLSESWLIGRFHLIWVTLFREFHQAWMLLSFGVHQV